MSQGFDVETRGWKTPAWLLSAVLHLSVLIGLALAVGGRSPPPPKEVDRSVGIVLAKATQEAAYFEPSTQTQLETSPSATESPSSSSLAAALAGPSAAGTDAQSSAELPSDVDLQPGAGELLAGLVGSGGGQGRLLSGISDEEILADDPLLNRPAVVLGPAATFKAFGAKSQGRSFVLLIDRSKSMGGEGLGAIDAAERELNRALLSLTPQQKFQIIAYNQSLDAMDPKLLPATDEAKALAAKFLKEIAAYGQTEHFYAITAALRSRPEVVFVFTDGGDPHLTPAQVRSITVHNEGKTAIHCIHFGQGPAPDDEHFLRQLARLNGGGYVYVEMK
jgi:hypothetical protein